MMNITEQYKDKQLIEMECEVLPTDYQEWLDSLEITPEMRDKMELDKLIPAF